MQHLNSDIHPRGAFRHYNIVFCYQHAAIISDTPCSNSHPCYPWMVIVFLMPARNSKKHIDLLNLYKQVPRLLARHASAAFSRHPHATSLEAPSVLFLSDLCEG